MEEESKSSEISVKSSEEVTTGAVLFSTVGNQEENMSINNATAEDTIDDESEKEVEAIKPDNVDNKDV